MEIESFWEEKTRLVDEMIMKYQTRINERTQKLNEMLTENKKNLEFRVIDFVPVVGCITGTKRNDPFEIDLSNNRDFYNAHLFVLYHVVVSLVPFIMSVSYGISKLCNYLQ